MRAKITQCPLPSSASLVWTTLIHHYPCAGQRCKIKDQRSPTVYPGLCLPSSSSSSPLFSDRKSSGRPPFLARLQRSEIKDQRSSIKCVQQFRAHLIYMTVQKLWSGKWETSFDLETDRTSAIAVAPLVWGSDMYSHNDAPCLPSWKITKITTKCEVLDS